MLPLSHDEVVHLKGSMILKMPGEYNEKFAQLRALYAYMFTFPGKKLNFMGNDLAQFSEWNEKEELDWFLKLHARHDQMSAFFSALGKLYLDTPALYEQDTKKEGFSLLVGDDSEQNVLIFRRIAKNGDSVVVCCNFSPVKRENYRFGIPQAGRITPLFSSVDERFGGCGTPMIPVEGEPIPSHGLPFSVSLTLPSSSVTLYSMQKI